MKMISNHYCDGQEDKGKADHFSMFLFSSWKHICQWSDQMKCSADGEGYFSQGPTKKRCLQSQPVWQPLIAGAQAGNTDVHMTMAYKCGVLDCSSHWKTAYMGLCTKTGEARAAAFMRPASQSLVIACCAAWKTTYTILPRDGLLKNQFLFFIIKHNLVYLYYEQINS